MGGKQQKTAFFDDSPYGAPTKNAFRGTHLIVRHGLVGRAEVLQRLPVESLHDTVVVSHCVMSLLRLPNNSSSGSSTARWQTAKTVYDGEFI